MNRHRVALVSLAAGLLFTALGPIPATASEFRSAWPAGTERVWIGPEYWANPLHEWRVADGRLECVAARPNRSVHVLTRELAPGPGDLRMRVQLGLPRGESKKPAEGDKAEREWAGYLVGVRGEYGDYRDSAIYGVGLRAGIMPDGTLFFEKPGDYGPVEGPKVAAGDLEDGVELRFEAVPGSDGYELKMTAHEPRSGRPLAQLGAEGASADLLVGNIALASSFRRGGGGPRGARTGAWFRDWTITGNKVTARDERAFGPILFSMYTLSRGTLKMTAQMPPLGEQDGRSVSLLIPGKREGGWKTAATAAIDPLSRTATLRVEEWDASRDVPYRLTCELFVGSGRRATRVRTGTIRRDPVGKEEIVVAAFTGNNDVGYPHQELVAHVAKHDPDVMFFSGDQIYERVAGFGTTRSPLEVAALDYLRKWYLLGWTFGDLLRDRPMIAIPDDHDVYHGNIWGAGGKAADPGGGGSARQDSGGYTMPAEWVRMVERTQTSHLPDPPDPRPVKQGIGVYFCEMNYGGVSFAILEDRKFKSAPKTLLPDANVRNGWARNLEWDAKKGSDAPGAVLLGERQLALLRAWALDWSGGAWMKVALSQTIFSNVATIPKTAKSGAVLPGQPIPKPGEYLKNEKVAADMDSNGWPPSGRDRAIRELRRCFAFHIAGDQHLGSTIRYGVDDWNDAGYALCVPSVSNLWPRRWFPPPGSGRNRAEGAPAYTGEFEDGFGNKMTVHAVSNPRKTGHARAKVYDRSPGYGIVRLRREDRSILIECWPRWVDPSDPGATQYPGWPIRIHQSDNYDRAPFGWLPTLEAEGMADPVVQVIEERTGEMIYSVRIQGSSFRPRVFRDGRYTIRYGNPDTGQWKELRVKTGDR